MTDQTTPPTTFDLTEARAIVVDAIRRMRAGHVACHDLTMKAEAFLAATHAAAKSDQLWDQTLQDRDRYHEVADSLAQGIAKHLGADIGEHSSANCPWERALEALDEAQGVPIPAMYATEINRLRNVIQAACTGGLDHMIERWKVLFPDAPVPSVQAAKPTRVLTEHSGCGQGAQVDQLSVTLHPGDRVLLEMGKYSAALAKA